MLVEQRLGCVGWSELFERRCHFSIGVSHDLGVDEVRDPREVVGAGFGLRERLAGLAVRLGGSSRARSSPKALT